jgi:hypothetical protein
VSAAALPAAPELSLLGPRPAQPVPPSPARCSRSACRSCSPVPRCR